MTFLPPLRNIVLAFAAPALFAQPLDLKLDHLSLEQGLSQSTVNAIVQDVQGFVWFGTQDGLNRYDGYSINVYKHQASDSNSIADNSIWSLLRDHGGNLWIGTLRGGADLYIPLHNRFIHHQHDPADTTSLSENNVISLFEDSYGNIWLGTLNEGVNRFNPQTGRFRRYSFDGGSRGSLSNNTVWCVREDFHRNIWVATWQGLCMLKPGDEHAGFVAYHHNPADRNSLAGESIRALCVDHRGMLWVGTWGAGVDRFDEKTRTFKHYAHDARNPRSISSNLILSMHEDTKGNLWIGTNDAGLNLYNPSDDDFARYHSDPNSASSLNDNQVSSLWEDNAGSLWIGTGAGGVNVFDWKKNRFKHYRDAPNNPNDLNGNDVWAILEDRNGELWVGTYGSGLNKFDRTRSNVINYRFNLKNPASLSHNNVLSLCEGSDGSIWVGTEGGGLNRFDRSTNSFIHYKHEPSNPNSISLDEITALLEDNSGSLWIGNNGGGIDRFDLRTQKFHHYPSDERNPHALSGTSVMRIYQDKQGTLWVGTLGGGLHRYNVQTDSFVRYRLPAEKNSSVNYNTVLSIYQDDAGILWTGTYGGGLNCFHTQRVTPSGEGYAMEQFKHYTEADGLPNDVVYGILPDMGGYLWLSTNKGLSRFNPQTESFRNYDVKDGLQGNEFNQGSYFRSRSGELFFGGINGLNAFFPGSIKDNTFVPPVYVTSFKVFDKPMPLAEALTAVKHIQLSYAENFFSFEFVALNYTSPEKNRYMYMLEGLDKNWISASASRRYASYTNLDPGEYVLRVKGSNNDGVWNDEGAAIGITITPPYWRTWWFRVLAAFIIAGILYLMYRYRVTKLLEIERIRSSIATDLHDDIGSTLTEIALFSDVGLREVRAKALEAHVNGGMVKVETLLEDIGTTSRGLIDAMNDIVWAVDPKNDSFEFLLLRMKTHAARMFDAKGINYEIDIPEQLSHLHLPLGFRRRFYLIFKEAVNNILRHAHPSRVFLKIRKEGHSLVMTIVDDGNGFDMEHATPGNGLNNMHKRAESLNGSLSVESALKKGTTVNLKAPIP